MHGAYSPTLHVWYGSCPNEPKATPAKTTAARITARRQPFFQSSKTPDYLSIGLLLSDISHTPTYTYSWLG